MCTCGETTRVIGSWLFFFCSTVKKKKEKKTTLLECSSEPSGIDSARTSLPDVHTRGQAVSFPTEPAELDVDGERAPRLLWQQRRREPVRVRGCFVAAQTEGDSAGRKRGTRGARGPADGSRALRDNRRAGRRRAAPSRANLDERVRRCVSRGRDARVHHATQGRTA